MEAHINMFHRILDWFAFGPKKPKVKPEVKIADLQKKTKKELEAIGRKMGVELDRRLTKAKLIQQIKKLNK